MTYPRRRLPLYFIPIIIGFGGVLISRQFTDLSLRIVVLAVSVSVPVFVAVSLLSRYRTSRSERFTMFGGVLLLLLGAAASLSGLTDTFFASDRVPPEVVEISRLIGMLSLLLGVFTILYMVARAGEDIQLVGERFWHLAQHITEGFILSKPDGTILLVNKQFLEMSGLREEEVVGRNSYELAQRLDVQPMQEALRKRARGIASEYEVTWIVRGEERRFWFNGSPIFDRQGRHSANLATVRDVTEQHQLSKRVERYAASLQQLVDEQTRKLRSSEERFRQLLLSMNEGFLTLDDVNHIRFANESICEMLGYAREELLDQDVFNFVDSGAKVRLLNLLARSESLRLGEARQEVSLLRRDGSFLPAMVAISHIPDSSAGEPVYSLVVTNVAELKEMQTQLELRARELERANEEMRMHDRAKDIFLSNVSHELRTPLATIQGYVEMIESGSLGEVESGQRSALKVMQRNISRLLGLINEIIDFSRMEIRGVQLSVSLFNVERLMREAVASAHPGALAREVELSVAPMDRALFAWGDREKLAQVLGILLNNAVKFTPAGGQIEVSAAVQSEQDLILCVSDTGIGIDAAFHEKVFDKFFQVDSSKSRRYEGTGIGLSIAKSIVEAHHGRFELRSQPGKGSQFFANLPGALLNAQVTPEALSGLVGQTVLIANESEAFAEAVGGLLSDWGIKVEFSSPGYQCVRSAEHHAPHLILLNDSPADVAGATTLPLLRQAPATAELPVIVSTAEPQARLREPAELQPEVLYLQKPFTAHVLVERLRLALQQGEAEEFGREDREAQPHAPRPKVLLIDSDPCLLEWVETALLLRGIPCGCAADARKALPLVDQEPPDVIFMSLDEPGNVAEEQVALLREMEGIPDVPLFLMTGLPGGVGSVAGAAGILYKPFSIDQMVNLIEGVRDASASASAGSVPA